MSANNLEWLKLHDARVEVGSVVGARFVLIGGAPQYKLLATPADGKFGCAVMQTVNGKRLDKGEIYPSHDEAIQGGLEVLRKALGW